MLRLAASRLSPHAAALALSELDELEAARDAREPYVPPVRVVVLADVGQLDARLRLFVHGVSIGHVDIPAESWRGVRAMLERGGFVIDCPDDERLLIPTLPVAVNDGGEDAAE